MRTTNKQCEYHVNHLEEFKASNLSGEYKLRDGKIRYYVVQSYGWYPLWVWDFEAMTWYSNKDKYSVSTSRQKAQSRPFMSGNAIELSHDELKELLR